MTTIIAKHGQTYTYKAGDLVKFPFPVLSLKSDDEFKAPRDTFRWLDAKGVRRSAYFHGLPALELVEGTTYRAASAVEVPAPEPTPAPPPPPPPPPVGTDLTAAIVNGEAFLQNDAMTVGFNAWGGIGTAKNAPDQFRTDKSNNWLRVGIFAPPLTDIPLPGRSIEGSGWVINGVRYANMMLAGWRGIPGTFTDPQTWVGNGAGIKTEQRVTMTERTIRIEMTDTNVTDKPMTLQPFRSIDPDQNDKFVTTNKVTAPGVMECTLAGKVGKLVVRAPGASFHYSEYDQCHNIGTPQAVGVTRAKDEVVQPVWPAYTLNPGASQVRVLEYEVVLP